MNGMKEHLEYHTYTKYIISIRHAASNYVCGTQHIRMYVHTFSCWTNSYRTGTVLALKHLHTGILTKDIVH